MSTELNQAERDCRRPRVIQQSGPSGAVYGMGFIGACVYYIGTAGTFWLGVLGLLKAIVWPAMLVYELLKFLNM